MHNMSKKAESKADRREGNPTKSKNSPDGSSSHGKGNPDMGNNRCPENLYPFSRRDHSHRATVGLITVAFSRMGLPMAAFIIAVSHRTGHRCEAGSANHAPVHGRMTTALGGSGAVTSVTEFPRIASDCISGMTIFSAYTASR